jgi:hypothetical protein
MYGNKPSPLDDDDDYYESPKPRQGLSPILWVVIGVVGIGCVCAILGGFVFNARRQTQMMLAEREAMEAERDAQNQAAKMRLARDAEFITPEELDKIPEGIKVLHEPKMVLASLSGKSVRRSKYTWWYKTTVSTADDDVTIIQFGGFAWKDGKWFPGSFTGKPYTVEDFADWYKCPKGVLKKGESYSDPTNWASEPELVAGKTRWYFIGVDGTGRRVKGEAIVELKAEIDPIRPKDPE